MQFEFEYVCIYYDGFIQIIYIKIMQKEFEPQLGKIEASI